MVAAACGWRTVGVWQRETRAGKAGRAPTVPTQGLPVSACQPVRPGSAQDWNAYVSGKKKVWGSVRMDPIVVSLTNYWSKIYPSCRPAGRRKRHANTALPRSLILSPDESTSPEILPDYRSMYCRLLRLRL